MSSNRQILTAEPPTRTRAARLRRALLAATLALCAHLAVAPAEATAAECRSSTVPAYEMAPRAAAKATLCLINKQRTSRGLGKLKMHSGQNRAAKSHNDLMLKRDCFAHVCPGELDLLKRILDFGYLPCLCKWGVAENIAYGEAKSSSPRSIVDAWMKSPGHRKNILDRSFQHIGIAVSEGLPIKSSHQGATYTTDFGYKR